MKLLLTSNGLENNEISLVFKNLFNKAITDVKVLFIPTASRTEFELTYVTKSIQELIKLGVSDNNIFSYSPDKQKLSNFDKFDCIYVCGGNTYYLLDVFKKTGFDKQVIKLVNEGLIYVGVSAGSIIAGPNIEITGTDDENDCKITDLSSLNLTECIISPHFCKDEEEYVADFRKNSIYPVIGLKDNEAIVIIK